MERIRRTKYFFLYFEEVGFVDLSQVLRGVAELSTSKQILALPILKGECCAITMAEMQILSEISSAKWLLVSEVTERLGVSLELIHGLAQKGLILSDDGDESLAELRKRDEELSSFQWNIYAALYHFMTKWQDVHLKIDLPEDLQSLEGLTPESDEAFRRFVDLFGKPPGHFYSVPNAVGVHNLPVIKKSGDFYDVLMKRKTTRAFDKLTPMKLEDLCVVLQYVWGCHGFSPVFQDIVGLKKTSPSGGDLHPIEVYPLVTNVKGLDIGLYHYSVKDHALELLTGLSQDKASHLANEFTAGQQFPRSAHVLFIMIARFYRNFWKYRQHQKSYSVILMDAAHLSQTFYLVCTQLGLGAFITAAINSSNIEQKLGLDGISGGPVAICGCGVPLGKSSLEPEFLPYIPRQSML